MLGFPTIFSSLCNIWQVVNSKFCLPSSYIGYIIDFHGDKCVLRSAARLIGRVYKFDHISAYMRDVRHWLPLSQRIQFRVAVLVWYSLIGQASAYLADLCCPSLTARSTHRLRSAEQGLLHVPFARTSTMQSRAFSVVSPLVWNGLPLALRSLPRVFSLKFLQQLKTTLFGRAGVGSASE